ncbi:class I SAM-dependent methyltransferase [Agromyces atrinae]|uniref:SAM-dependent methyltransferase n=1 Tax=Agromyces atrinae TaxID=592376 RepID=A0A4Q2M6Q8_9MICO|nr:class I SAM-dependent methyltransferase [Agromyces atrinae]NYD68180.1 SAM-dependent methyltransferase [Agromyces atrinae]RXZ87679.1 class I SAM-dependent methyltransferase [Agromyces atrinae]
MTTEGPTAAEYWENRYREGGRSWSGDVNAALAREVDGLAPGTALDLGSGEGGDALWLARHGWRVTAVDISPTALAVGAAAQLPGDDITWVAADLSDWQPPTSYDLVSSCFLHSLVELPRERILRRAATAVAPGGTLVIVGHFGVPHWATPAEHAHAHDALPGPDEMRAALFADNPDLIEAEWEVVTSALIERPFTAPDGSAGTISDSVLRMRRLA